MEQSLDEQLSLFQTNKLLLNEMKLMNQLLVKQVQLAEDNKLELQKLVYLLNAFTSNGMPIRSYLPDHLLTAYLHLAGPALGQRISDENHDPNEVLKGGIEVAKQMLDEINAYNASNAPGQAAIENALRTAHDPWAEQETGQEDQET